MKRTVLQELLESDAPWDLPCRGMVDLFQAAGHCLVLEHAQPIFHPEKNIHHPASIKLRCRKKYRSEAGRAA
jgi:hypothetical protein